MQVRWTLLTPIEGLKGFIVIRGQSAGASCGIETMIPSIVNEPFQSGHAVEGVDDAERAGTPTISLRLRGSFNSAAPPTTRITLKQLPESTQATPPQHASAFAK
ncbi:MAG: hypothetical protein JNM56_04160 [Planctomycetia bacterium]|nr:hypothetical protein [Planctomycetia bacterium]